MLVDEFEALKNAVLHTTLPTYPTLSIPLLMVPISARLSHRSSVLYASNELDELQATINVMISHLQTLRVAMSTRKAHLFNALIPISALPSELLHDIFHRAVYSSSSPLDMARKISQTSNLFRAVSLEQRDVWSNLDLDIGAEGPTLPLPQIETAISRSEGGNRSLTIRNNILRSFLMRIVTKPVFRASLTHLCLVMDNLDVRSQGSCFHVLDESFPFLQTLSLERPYQNYRQRDIIFRAFPSPNTMPELRNIDLHNVYLHDTYPAPIMFKALTLTAMNVTSYFRFLPPSLERLVIEDCICAWVSQAKLEHPVFPALHTLIVSYLRRPGGHEDPRGLPFIAPSLEHLTLAQYSECEEQAYYFIHESPRIRTLRLKDHANSLIVLLTKLESYDFGHLEELRVETVRSTWGGERMEELAGALKQFLAHRADKASYSNGTPSSDLPKTSYLQRLIIPHELMKYQPKEYAQYTSSTMTLP